MPSLPEPFLNIPLVLKLGRAAAKSPNSQVAAVTLIPSKAILSSRVLIFRRGTEKSTHSSGVREACGRDGGVGAIFLEPDFGKE